MPAVTEPVAESVEELQRELARLRHDFDARIAAVERKLAALAPKSVAAPLPAAPEPVSRPAVSPEVIAIIAAAVTSYLGKKVKIRHAHLLDSGTSPWAQQGRAIIFASHNLSR